MKFRKMGASGLLVSELTLGTMIFGEPSQRSTPAEEAERTSECPATYSQPHRFGAPEIFSRGVYAER